MSRGTIIGLILALGVIAGITLFVMRPKAEPVKAGQTLERSEIAPDAAFSDQAELIFQDIPVPVAMKRSVKDDEVRFDFLSMEEILDSEKYVMDQSSFGLKEMNLESYSPPIPLLKFPLMVGNKWEWNGVQESGGRTHKSWATISTEIVTLPEFALETVHVTVDLFIDSTVGRASERKIEFWFTKGRGIVKRTYGDSIARVSLSEGDSSE